MGKLLQGFRQYLRLQNPSYRTLLFEKSSPPNFPSKTRKHCYSKSGPRNYQIILTAVGVERDLQLTANKSIVSSPSFAISANSALPVDPTATQGIS